MSYSLDSGLSAERCRLAFFRFRTSVLSASVFFSYASGGWTALEIQIKPRELEIHIKANRRPTWTWPSSRTSRLSSSPTGCGPPPRKLSPRLLAPTPNQVHPQAGGTPTHKLGDSRLGISVRSSGCVESNVEVVELSHRLWVPTPQRMRVGARNLCSHTCYGPPLPSTPSNPNAHP